MQGQVTGNVALSIPSLGGEPERCDDGLSSNNHY